MQDNNLKSNNESEDDVSQEMQEALAAFFEQRNGGQVDKLPTQWLATSQQADWQQAQALLGIPERALASRPNLDSAWQSFRVNRFEVAPVTDAANLGSYVAQNEQAAIKESGLSPATLEALKADQTPLETLKGYELNDYAALARRYEVKDSAFPRMLKWLKALGKSLTTPAPSMSRGMMFARDDEPRTPGVTEMELAEGLEVNEEKDTKGEEL